MMINPMVAGLFHSMSLPKTFMEQLEEAKSAYHEPAGRVSKHAGARTQKAAAKRRKRKK